MTRPCATSRETNQSRTRPQAPKSPREVDRASLSAKHGTASKARRPSSIQVQTRVTARQACVPAQAASPRFDSPFFLQRCYVLDPDELNAGSLALGPAQ